MGQKGKLQFLGTGASMGVPMIGCHCPVCTSPNPKNQRTRPGALLEVGGKTLWIDAGPDFRNQALAHHIEKVDGVIFTHAHHDHTGGMDDLRALHILQQKPIPCLMSKSTHEDLKNRYSYIFTQANHPHQLTSKLDVEEFRGDSGSTHFLGIDIDYLTYTQAGMAVNGIRIGDLAYLTDIKHYSESIFEQLTGVKVLVVSALRFAPSPLHLTLDEAVAFSKRIQPRETWLIHISHDMEHEKTNASLSENIRLAYDGLVISF